MKKAITIITAALLAAVGALAQEKTSKIEFNEDVDLSLRKGAFSTEFVSYISWGDHTIIKDDDGYDGLDHRSEELVLNLVELRVHPYETGLFFLGVDLDWDFYRLNRDHFWQPDGQGGVGVSTDSAFKKIKKSDLVVRTVAVPVGFEQSFGKCALRIGGSAEYNFQGLTKFKAVDNSGSKIKETRSGPRYSDDLKVNKFTYSVSASLSFGGIGAYVKYNPMAPFEKGFGPQYKMITLGVVVGLGM